MSVASTKRVVARAVIEFDQDQSVDFFVLSYIGEFPSVCEVACGWSDRVNPGLRELLVYCSPSSSEETVRAMSLFQIPGWTKIWRLS